MDLLASLSVSSDAPEGAEHPRLAGYKNLGKVEENQRQRRSDDMQRRNQSRDDWVMRGRLIEEDENMEELNPEQINPFAPRPRRKCHFKNMLMFSDWLVDIPETMSSEWTLMAAPVGRRCLVVGHRNKTNIFYKNGYLSLQFESTLPGGGPVHPEFTKNSKFYVLDLLWWNNKMYTDSDFTMRQFFMRSKIEELNIENKNANKANQFIPLPTCPCLPEAMAEFMKTKFPYELDGLLFYFNSGFYISEQTPLVGWLKPWMLPEENMDLEEDNNEIKMAENAKIDNDDI
uniref:Snurportin-1 n=1 Tax=Meloidogyne javanica TaxID=6303 RepID=A0A915LU70_MELJA